MTPLAVLAVGEAMVELSASDEGGLWHLGYAGDTLNTAWYCLLYTSPSPRD